MNARAGGSWIVYPLGVLAAGAIVAAVLVVGPASGQQPTATRTIAARRGVVQSTVSGNGNVQAASQLDLGFKTAGTVTQIYAHQGEHVAEGQLLATLDPQSARVTLEQAKASLQSAEAALSREQETDGEGVGAAKASASATAGAPRSGSSQGNGSSQGSSGSSSADRSSGESQGTSSVESATPASETISPATRRANLASARATVKSDKLTVRGDEQAVADTRLTAPQSETIVSLSGEVGETVSGGGTSRASASGESAAASGSSGGDAEGGAGAAAGSSGSSDSSGSSAGSSESSFAVLSDLSAMKLVVGLSESEVGSVRAGQPATVTVEALKGAKLAAHVSEVATLATSSSGVVSYDVTFALDQLAAGLKPGMSASAEVVVEQAEGINVPTSAISGGSVTVIRGGKQQRQAVTTGLAGNSSTIVLSGLRAGEQVVLPPTGTSSASSLLSRLGSRGGGTLGAGGLAGGGFAVGGVRGGFAGGGARGGASPGG